MVVIITGPQGSGKTTLAEAFVEIAGAPLIVCDEVGIGDLDEVKAHLSRGGHAILTCNDASLEQVLTRRLPDAVVVKLGR